MGHNPVYETTRRSDGKWFWKLTAGGVIPLGYSAVTYESKAKCQRAIEGINHINDVANDDNDDDSFG